ncbi:BTB/POZ domain-containing protein [Sesamum angolense]|uniref:BTB/POZ domain-containing protein n=1 Tax=Sesamum angolense TaxID=2727404 RepID=A0AAE2C2V3_9LAMI|nr:BTB/POZ domain-containing protein [Sesamum angolense]
MGVVTVAELKPSISGKRSFRPVQVRGMLLNVVNNACARLPYGATGAEAPGFWLPAYMPISDVSSDLTIEVGTASFALHKFPLVSRSGRIRKLLSEAKDSKISRLNLSGVPGGSQAFELAAKFCYGVNIEITVSNVGMLRCAAHFLEMTEEFSDKNLEARTEVYLKDTVLPSIPNSITVLHHCEGLLPTAEEINLSSRLINGIANNACKEQLTSGLSKLEHNFPSKHSGADGEIPSDWWGKSLTLLSLDFFQRVLSAVKTKGLKQDMISRILINYAKTPSKAL